MAIISIGAISLSSSMDGYDKYTHGFHNLSFMFLVCFVSALAKKGGWAL